ncbi:GNAT family N-acetyltransferase [Solibacillus sp. CAU 1738]|uniref:GNAT family N-acetyltransferase n=1 Tax=Solibacillus sp. CAU 1738 TaxID=3140363 RepID=UPI003260B6F2
MNIKIVPQEDYEQIHRLRDYSFPNKYEGKRRQDFHYWIEHSTTLGAYDFNKVVGQLLILPLNMTVHGVNLQMGGIGFVATYPEYRNQGIMKKLIVQALKEMRKNGQLISVLAPYSVSFYRYFGWEIFFDKLKYSIPVEAFPNFGRQNDTMKRTSFEWIDEEIFQDIQQFHNEHALKSNGGMTRDKAWWQRLARREPDNHLAAYYNANKIAGYIRYNITSLTFSIKDFVADDLYAEQAIWRFITSHKASVEKIEGATSIDSHIGFNFDQPQFNREVSQDVMVRIVDAFAFMQNYPWQTIHQPLYIQLEDIFCPWNEHLYKINKDGHVTIIEEKSVEDVHMLKLSINLFSAMMVGYLSLMDVLKYSQKVMSEECLVNWQRAIPVDFPKFFEYY